MNDSRVRLLLWTLAVAMASFTGLFLLEKPVGTQSHLPQDSTQLARRLAQHPTDWWTAMAISDQALDSLSPQRFETWRRAAALAAWLAPHTEAARTGFVRAGLFHWYELDEDDRRTVLIALAPTLRDPLAFQREAQALFDLTGDLEYLRRVQPHTIDTIEGLSEMAVTNGRFEDYRQLRRELVVVRTRALIGRLDTLSPSQIVAALPPHPTTDDEPMIHAALRTLERRPLEVDCGRPDILDHLIDYAAGHHLPLAGLRGAIPEKTWAGAFQRAELARALGHTTSAEAIGPELRPTSGEIARVNGVSWSGFCGLDVCNRITADVTGPLSVTIAAVGGDEVPPYVECMVDDVRIWEGAIVKRVTVPLAPAGRHHVEIMLANHLTRNRGQRRVRIS